MYEFAGMNTLHNQKLYQEQRDWNAFMFWTGMLTPHGTLWIWSQVWNDSCDVIGHWGLKQVEFDDYMYHLEMNTVVYMF